MRRAAGLWCVLFAATVVGRTQQTPQAYLDSPSADKIVIWLHSASPQDRAWGAYWAVKQNDASFLPALEGLAERWERMSSAEEMKKLDAATAARVSDERDAMAGVLDGVILFRGSLTPETLEKLAHDFPAQSVILLARMPSSESRETLLKLYAETLRQFDLRRVVARMLSLDPPPGFAASMLKMTIWIEVYVSPPGNEMSEMGTGTACRAQAPHTARPGWPSMGLYRLVEASDSGEPGEFAVIGGRHPIDARRIEAAQWAYICDLLPNQSDANRIQMIAQMIGEENGELPIHSYEEIHIHPASTEDYLKQLNEFVAAEKRKIASVQAQLEAKGLLTRQEVDRGDAQPRLLLKMIDGIDPKQLEVPTPGLGDRVAWAVPGKEWYDPQFDW